MDLGRQQLRYIFRTLFLKYVLFYISRYFKFLFKNISLRGYIKVDKFRI